MKKYILEDKSSGKFFLNGDATFTSNRNLAKAFTREEADDRHNRLIIKGVQTWILPLNTNQL